MRCFIAIDIDDTVKAAIADLQEDLRQSVDLRPGEVKWVSPDAMHLTLKFLGETPDTHVVDICRLTERVAKRHGCFRFELQGVGSFGGRNDI